MKLIKTLFVLSLINFVLILNIVASVKIAGKFSETEQIKATQTQSPTQTETEDLPTPSVATTKTEPVVKPITAPAFTTTPTPTEQTIGCLIIIDGVSYDIKNFISQHGGGDVFVCGSDMSSAFHDQHPDSYLEKIAKYKI